MYKKYFEIMNVALPGRYIVIKETKEQRRARDPSKESSGQMANLITKTTKYTQNQYLQAMDDLFGAHLWYEWWII